MPQKRTWKFHCCFCNFFCAKSVVATFCPVRWERNGPIIKERRRPPLHPISLFCTLASFPLQDAFAIDTKQTLEKCYFKKPFSKTCFLCSTKKSNLLEDSSAFVGTKCSYRHLAECFFPALLNPSQQDNQQRRNTTSFHPYSKRRKKCFFWSDGPYPIFELQEGGGRVGIKFREQSSLPESAAQEWGKIETDAPYFRFFCAKTRVVA